jgi:hypothetical protein
MECIVSLDHERSSLFDDEGSIMGLRRGGPLAAKLIPGG